MPMIPEVASNIRSIKSASVLAMCHPHCLMLPPSMPRFYNAFNQQASECSSQHPPRSKAAQACRTASSPTTSAMVPLPWSTGTAGNPSSGWSMASEAPRSPRCERLLRHQETSHGVTSKAASLARFEGHNEATGVCTVSTGAVLFGRLKIDHDEAKI